MEYLTDLPDWLITTVIAVLGGIILWINRQRLGLGEVQMATKSEQGKVIELQERRIELLEAEVLRLKAEVLYLSSENEEYRRRITRLETHERRQDGTGVV